MTFAKTTKIIGASILVAGFMSGTASAGDKHNCDKTKKTTVQKTEMKQETVVLPASTAAEKTKMKTLTYEQALEKCEAYGATDIQACAAKKSGVTKPGS